MQSLYFIIINNSQIALPPPSTSLQFPGLLQRGIMLLLFLQTILYLPLICQMQWLATNMSNAVPVENSNFSKFKSPEDYISLKSTKMDCLELNLCTCKYKSTPKDQTGSSLGNLWDRKVYRDSLQFLTSMIRNSWGLAPCNLQAPRIYWKKFHL